jgi:hypothetical protein
MSHESTAAEGSWRCRDCGAEQVSTAHEDGSPYGNQGWFWQILPGAALVLLCQPCFIGYGDDWPSAGDANGKLPWRSGAGEGRWLWVMPDDRAPGQKSPATLARWEATGDDWWLRETGGGRVLGHIKATFSGGTSAALYQPLDADQRTVPGSRPVHFVYAKNAVEAHLGMTWPADTQPV